MATIADLAREFNAQPYEVAAFADLDRSIRDDDDLDADTEAMIREAWAAAPRDEEALMRAGDKVLDELRNVVDDAGYDY